jgi:hypothetical protein
MTKTLGLAAIALLLGAASASAQSLPRTGGPCAVQAPYYYAPYFAPSEPSVWGAHPW